jgi:hypothetical protein
MGSTPILGTHIHTTSFDLFILLCYILFLSIIRWLLTLYHKDRGKISTLRGYKMQASDFEDCVCEGGITLPPHDTLFARLFAINDPRLEGFNSLLLEKSGDEFDIEGLAFLIVVALSEISREMRNEVLNNLNQIISALIPDTDNQELVTDIQIQVNRLLVVGT